jgi:hypothetical protein
MSNRWVRPATATQGADAREDTMKRSQSRSDADNGRVAANGVSRRELVAAGGAMAAAATSSSLIANTASAQGSAGADATLDRLRRAAGDSGRRILIRGGTIISMDTGIGDFAAGDVLIERKRISAVGPDLAGAGQAGNAIVVDAAGMVVIPGMIDCHRHSWEGQLHGIIPNSASIGDYMGAWSWPRAASDGVAPPACSDEDGRRRAQGT